MWLYLMATTPIKKINITAYFENLIDRLYVLYIYNTN